MTVPFLLECVEKYKMLLHGIVRFIPFTFVYLLPQTGYGAVANGRGM